MYLKKLHLTPTREEKNNTRIHSLILALIATLFLMVAYSGAVSAQCSGCTSAITTNAAAITVNSGQVVCITVAGTFNKAITINGGTLCIGPSTTVTSAITMPSGATLSIYGIYTGSMSQNGGSITAYSGGAFRPSSFSLNGGTLIISAGASSTLGTPTFPSGYVFTNNGSLTIAGFTINSGGTVTLTGTSQTITGGISNNGNFTLNGPATINGSFSQNGNTSTTFMSGVTITGSVSNNGTINLSGTLTINGSYSSNSPATIKASSGATCNAVSVGGSISGSGTYNGNSYAMTISPTPSCCMSNGATAAPVAPTLQPNTPNGSLSGNVVTGSFVAPSAAISGYIVLRSVGLTVPTCNPVNNTEYAVGSTIGSCTVAAIVPGGSTGTKTFTDNIPPSVTNCGSNINYRIFSYNGAGDCVQFNVTSPMTGSIPMTAYSATMTSSGATTFCAGSSTVLTSSAASSYLWSTGANTAAITASTSGTYTVTATSALGCTASASKTITVNAMPAATISGTTTICSGTSTTLTASGGTTYLWSTGATTAAITANTAGIYTVSATTFGCTDTAIRAVTVTPLPTPAVNSAAICTGGTATLTATGGGTYLWSTGATTAAITTTTAGTYRVTATTSGCSAVASGTVTMNAPPTPAVNNATICAGNSAPLTATGGISYVWNTTATTASITTTTAGTYTVTATNAAGCTAAASGTVTVNPIPSANITGNTSICTGSSTTLTASGGTTYLWSTGATTAAISVNAGGIYTVTATTLGCADTALRAVTVNTLPTVSVNSAAICTGGTATLTATAVGTYVWSTGATTASIATSAAGTYRVTVTSAAGCTASASGVVTINASPTATVTNPRTCPGISTTLTAGGGSTYLWSTGATTAAINTTTASSYTVTVTAANSCTASATGAVTRYTSPSVTASSNTPVCIGTSLILTANPSGSTYYTYAWSGPASYSATSAAPTIAGANTANGGSYSVIVTDINSCTATASTTVTVDGNCVDSTTIGANGGGSSDAPCTQVLRFDHYNDAVAAAGGQNHTWILKNGNKLTMTITRTAGAFTAVSAPTWSGAAFGQSGYMGLLGKTVLYTTASGYSKIVFSNIQMKDSAGTPINNFTLIGIDAESTDNAERDTLVSNGTNWFDYDTITPPGVNSVPMETGIGTSTLIWTGTGAANARSRLVSTNNPTNFSFATVAGGLQAFAMAISNPVQAPTALTICSKGSFNANATNLPVGTTYTWSAPVISPAGSITGATAQTTPVANVSQTLTNTTTANATATYTVIPSNNCSGLGYTVTITVKPSPTATISNSGPACIGGAITVTATPVAGAPLTYSWSGPASFTSVASAFTLSSGTIAQNGIYNVTITGSNSCTATTSGSVSFVNCLNVSGSVFNDGNGNGIVNSHDTVSSFGKTLFAAISDTNDMVISTGIVAANGAFTLSGILPSTSGMKVRICTTAPAIGTVVPAASWPTYWLGTLGQYGTNNLAGTGVYNNTSELIPVRTGTVNITGMMIGFDRLSSEVNQSYTISRPPRHTIKTLMASTGLGNITWTDPEDGENKGAFVVTAITAMHNNLLFYDSNANGTLEASEAINGYKVIRNFNNARLKMKFEGMSSINASFAFAYMDSASKVSPLSSTYTVQWPNGALPVTLEYFTAEKNDDHSSLLKWRTASEINNDRFEVERSADGRNWTKIGEIKGNGTSNEQHDYTYTDADPLAAINYYRLRQVDYDGQNDYTDVAAVEFTSSEAQQAKSTVVMTIYPNPLPAGRPLNIALAGSSDAIRHVSVTNQLGQEVYRKDPVDGQGYKLSDLTLTAGTYIISVISQSNETFATKIVVQ